MEAPTSHRNMESGNMLRPYFLCTIMSETRNGWQISQRKPSSHLMISIKFEIQSAKRCGDFHTLQTLANVPRLHIIMPSFKPTSSSSYSLLPSASPSKFYSVISLLCIWLVSVRGPSSSSNTGSGKRQSYPFVGGSSMWDPSNRKDENSVQ